MKGTEKKEDVFYFLGFERQMDQHESGGQCHKVGLKSGQVMVKSQEFIVNTVGNH